MDGGSMHVKHQPGTDMGMDMNHHMDMAGHKAHFHFSPKITVLIASLNVDSPLGLAFVSILFVLITLCHEGLRCLRMHLAAKHGHGTKRITITSKSHLVQTGLFCTEFIFAYAIMLMVMTFNAWLLISVAIGSGIGYQLCRLLSPPHRAPVSPPQVDHNKNTGEVELKSNITDKNTPLLGECGNDKDGTKPENVSDKTNLDDKGRKYTEELQPLNN